VLALSDEVTIGPLSLEGQATETQRQVLLGLGITLLLTAVFIQFNPFIRKAKIREDIERSIQDPGTVDKVISVISSVSNEYKQVLKPFASVAEESLRQDRIRSRLSEWIRLYTQDDWINGAISQEFLQKNTPKYIKANEYSSFCQDVKKLIEILGKNINMGEPNSLKYHSFHRNIDARYLYYEAIKRVEAEVLSSLERSQEMDDVLEKAKETLIIYFKILQEDIQNQE
jgi:hypothetical protein